ncbi:nucleoside diphosphate kinase, mitochondrial isoform X2 [Sardina pilchardus]|uniref:nucleoside diphosphate kinase, mitochondrial isoform X2 n=1 Tax=Sardina pilchardus TaxID=27697 RepID=UPI002E12F727
MALFPRCLLRGVIFPVKQMNGLPVIPKSITLHERARYNSNSAGVRERTLVAVKPDGVQRRLIGQIIQRFEIRGFRLVGLKMLPVSDELLSQHYSSLCKKSFYPSLLHYMTSGPVVAMVWEGYNVVRSSRMLVGHTNPAEAPPGTIRGDFCIHISSDLTIQPHLMENLPFGIRRPY